MMNGSTANVTARKGLGRGVARRGRRRAPDPRVRPNGRGFVRAPDEQRGTRWGTARSREVFPLNSSALKDPLVAASDSGVASAGDNGLYQRRLRASVVGRRSVPPAWSPGPERSPTTILVT